MPTDSTVPPDEPSPSKNTDRVALSRALELARQTYAEVLDATKHQDDKVNRFLVAIAFLTSGAIAFVLKVELLDARYELGAFHLPVIAISAALYLTGTISAVIMLLMVLSTELKIPGRPKSPDSDVALDESLLYFQMIGSQPLRMWLRRWDVPDDQLEEQLRKQYLRESHNLSERARVKYGLTDEAASVYIYSLMWLGAGLLLGTHAAQTPGTLASIEKSTPLALSLAGIPACLLGVVFAGHAALQLYNVFRHERSAPDVFWRVAAARNPDMLKANFPYVEDARLGRRHGRTLRTLVRLIVLTPTYIALSLLSATSTSPQQMWLAISTAAVAAVCWIATWPRLGNRPYLNLVMFLALVAGTSAPLLSWTLHQPWLSVLAAAGPPSLLSALTVIRQIRQSRIHTKDRARDLLDHAGLAAEAFGRWGPDYWTAPSRTAESGQQVGCSAPPDGRRTIGLTSRLTRAWAVVRDRDPR